MQNIWKSQQGMGKGSRGWSYNWIPASSGKSIQQWLFLVAESLQQTQKLLKGLLPQLIGGECAEVAWSTNWGLLVKEQWMATTWPPGISSAHYVSPWGCFATPFFLEEESYVLHKLQLHLWHLPIDGFQKGCLIAHQDLVWCSLSSETSLREQICLGKVSSISKQT